MSSFDLRLRGRFWMSFDCIEKLGQNKFRTSAKFESGFNKYIKSDIERKEMLIRYMILRIRSKQLM